MTPMTESSSRSEAIWKIIDRETTLARLAEDEGLFGELVDFFLEDYGDLLAALATAVSRADASAMERAAHSLKGMSANLGATTVARAAGELEAMGRSGDVKDGARAELALRAELSQLVSALRDYRESRGTS